MSCKYTLVYPSAETELRLKLEDFGDAIVCEGRVFPRETVEHSVNTAPGQCWGNYIDVPAGAFVDGEYSERPVQLCIDDVGQSHTVTIVESLDPLRIRTILHRGVDADGEKEPKVCTLGLCWQFGEDYADVVGLLGSSTELLIPAEYMGLPVRRVCLSDDGLDELETLIISPGVKELSIDFYDSYGLSRLEIPDDICLLSPLDYISNTAWFRSRRPEPVYVAGCYCGTPGGGSGGVRSLTIPEGISSVAAGADFHSYWHSIKTPESLRSIGRLAFATCYCLEELNIAEGLKTIHSEAFYECRRLKSLCLPDSLEMLGDGSFTRATFLQDVSVPNEKFAEPFCAHRIAIRSENGEQIISKSPPIVIPLSDRIVAYPQGSSFTAAGKSYKALSELSHHKLSPTGSEYLDIHGRKIWLFGAIDKYYREGYAAIDDCFHDGLLERWYIKEDDVITQIEYTSDHSILVREGIGILDVPYTIRNMVAHDVFGLT